MRAIRIKNIFKRSQKAGQLLILGSLFSCSASAVKRPNLQQIQSRSLMKMEIMALWAKAEYRRLLGDEIGAQNLERDLKKLEGLMSSSLSEDQQGLGSN